MEKTYTKGDVIVEEIKIGDIHYEYSYNVGIEVQVISEPRKRDDGSWEWESKSVKTGKIIGYRVNPKYSHYGPNLYTYKAYLVKTYI